MYHTFFGLAEPAFSIAVNPRYLYMSQQHKEALAHLLYGVTGGGFVMLTGEVGTGKTTIIRCLLEQMPQNTDIAIVMNPMSNVLELLTTICDELGAPSLREEPTVKDLTDALHRFLLNNHTQGRNTVLLIDEAQLLSTQALEQVRLLTNLETTTQKLLHIILVGQPELKALVSKPELRQLAQRITARFHLTPLTFSETQAYIRHRLKIAGLPEGRSPFPYPIVKRIHAFTGGIPRLINVICERCLMGAYGSNKMRVDNAIFNAAKKEVIGGLENGRTAKQSLWLTSALIAVCVALLSAALYFNKSSHHAKSVAVASSSASSTSSAISSAASSIAPDFSIRNYQDAEDIFFEYLELPLATETRPCGRNLKAPQQCAKVSLHTWTDIRELNRPVILVLSTPEKFSTYVVLLGLKDESALIINAQQQRQIIPLNKIGRDWTGEAVYLWKRPPGFSETLLLGDTSPTVAWVAQQFAKLDKQKEPLSDDLFSIALHERIKIFQRTRGVTADGNITEQTLLKINEAVGADQTLLTTFDESIENEPQINKNESKEAVNHVPTP
ncbi:AAA family ATPase [Cellvibrio sp.]|uniref:ExeA family protein n=1 Tax=Cellvibrio sp. TaxID=1965322 RepID=UPI00396476C9